MVTIVLDRRDDGFHRLLTELFSAVLGTLVQQLAGVGSLSSRGRAGIDRGGETMNRKARHKLTAGALRGEVKACSSFTPGSGRGSSRIGSPARTIWSLASRM